MRHDEIRLALPAVPEYARIARLTVAGLATRLGFTYDEVEDLRIAVGEACSLLLGDGQQGTLILVYELDADAISIEAVIEGARNGAAAHAAEMSAQILTAVVDEHELDEESGRVRLVKRRGDG